MGRGLAYGNGVCPADEGNFVVRLDDAGVVDGGLELGGVDVDGGLGAVEGRDLIRVQGIDRNARPGYGAQLPAEGPDVAHVVYFRGSLALVGSGWPAVPEYRPGLRDGNPEDQIVYFDVVGHGAAREISSGEVVETKRALACNTDSREWFAHTISAGGTRSSCLSPRTASPLGRGGK